MNIIIMLSLVTQAFALDSQPDAEVGWGSDDPNTSGGGGWCPVDYCTLEQEASLAACMVQRGFWNEWYGPTYWCNPSWTPCACYTSTVSGCRYCDDNDPNVCDTICVSAIREAWYMYQDLMDFLGF